MVIGLTGGIASGKSTVADFLAQQGATVIDADQVSRDLMVPGSFVFSRIVEAFGPQVLNPDGSLDRIALGQIVFAQPERRRILEEITHPAIWEELESRLQRSRREGGDVVLMVPLLLEHGGERLVDQVWVVHVPEEVQIERLQRRNGLSRAEAEARLAAQMSSSERVGRADVVINNSGSQEETANQVRSAWNRHAHPPTRPGDRD